ncbi:hypothetical protein [Litoribacillus peritrichatus]|uniref:hypothetical protein n=1 Tax=Litoribacillus peritrichatus TaxID=718191 RepID=UPI0031D99F64
MLESSCDFDRQAGPESQMIRRITEQYQCAGCGQCFKCTDAVDGFKEGYEEGFLCPKCQANLVEYGQSDDIAELDYGISFTLLSLVLFYGLEGSVWVAWFDLHMLNEFATFMLAWLPLLGSFVTYNRKALFGKRIVYTRKVRAKR